LKNNMRLQVYNINGSSTGKDVELSDRIFGVQPNDHAVYLSVKSYLAAQRQGTHKTKERSEISGSTRKLHKQKGTGGSRKGDINSPLFPGGGRVFGPKPHLYDLKVNKKLKTIARNSALTYKAKAEKIKVVENFNIEYPKTKTFQDILAKLGLSGEKALLVTADHDKNIYLSARNLPKASVVSLSGLNTYNIMNAQTLIFTEGAISSIQ